MMVRYRSRARDDIERICKTIVRDNPAAAEHVQHAIRATGELLGEQPWLGVATDEPHVRRWPMPEYRHTIFYLVERDDDRIDILRVMDGRRVRNVKLVPR